MIDDADHPPTDRIELPSPRDSDAPAIHIPGPPGVPRLGPEEETLPPGTFVPPRLSEDPMVTALRHLLDDHEKRERAELDKHFAALRDANRLAFKEEAAALANPFLKRDEERKQEVALLRGELEQLRGRVSELEQRLSAIEQHTIGDGK